MKKSILALCVLGFAAACGANDPPFRPSANVGVSVGPNGVTPNASIGATNGTFNEGLNL